MGDRLATTGMGRKVGRVLCPFPWGAGPPSNIMSPRPRPTSVPSGIPIHPAVWPQWTWADKWEKGCCTSSGGAGPHLTQCGLSRASEAYLHAQLHLDLSNRLATIHQRYRQTDRTGQEVQRSDSIGRTVLQTVAPKSPHFSR